MYEAERRPLVGRKSIKESRRAEGDGGMNMLSTMMHVYEMSQNIHYFIHQKVIGDI